MEGKAKQICHGVREDNPEMSKARAARIANAVAAKLKKKADYPAAEASATKSGNIYPELLTELAAKIAKKFLDSGTPLNELLAEEANDLTPEQLQTVCQLINRAVHKEKFQESPFVKFPVADTSGVKNVLLAQDAKGKARKLLDDLPDDVPGPAVAKQASASTWTVEHKEKEPVPPASNAEIMNAGDDLHLALLELEGAARDFLKAASAPEDYAELLGAAAFVDSGHQAPFNLAWLGSKLQNVPRCAAELEKLASKVPNPYTPMVTVLRKVADRGDAYLQLLAPAVRTDLVQSLAKEAGVFEMLNPIIFGWHMWDKGKQSMADSKEGKVSTLLPPSKPRMIPQFGGPLAAPSPA